MQSRNKWRWAAIVAPPLLALGVATLVACRDAITNARSEPPNDARVTASSDSSAVSIPNRTHLSKRNPHDWVGVSHNRAFDEFRKQLGKPGVLTRNLCDYMLDFVSQPDRLPEGKAAGNSLGREQGARAGLATTAFCRRGIASARNTSFAGSEPSAVTQESEVSPAAYQLLSSVESAIEAATDSYDLAGRLNQVLDAAAGLTPVDQEVIGATVSTAQYSYEYWESELPAFQEEFWNEYSGCALQQRQAGVSSDNARTNCLEGGAAETTWPRTPEFGSPVIASFAGLSGMTECGLRHHFRRLAGADVVGAIVGGVRGIFGGPGGILAGAFAGGAYASFGSFIVSTWDLYWCAM